MARYVVVFVLVALSVHGAAPKSGQLVASASIPVEVRQPQRVKVGAAALWHEVMPPSESWTLRGRCEDGGAGSCWIVLEDGFPFEVILSLGVEHALAPYGDLESTPATRAPVRIDLKDFRWWDFVVAHGYSVTTGTVIPIGVRCDPPYPPTKWIDELTPQSVTCRLDSVPLGVWVVSLQSSLKLGDREVEALRAAPLSISVRRGDEDDDAEELQYLRESYAAREAGDFQRHVRITEARLARHPTSARWENFADNSVSRSPLDVTAARYASARALAEEEFIRSHPDASKVSAETRAAHLANIERLSTFERVLPYLKANPALKYHSPEYYLGGVYFFAVTGPDFSVSFTTFDESVAAKLAAAPRQ